MEFARTLRILWLRRRLVALGALVATLAALLSVYAVGLFPPSLTTRTNVFATASTQVLVDTPDSAFADLANDIDPLNARAGVFARFLASPAAILLIAREANLPPGAIEAQGPFELNVPEVQRAPTAERRSSQILGEGALYRLRFENNSSLPIVTVYAQAPSREGAVGLAEAAPAALRDYIDRIQSQQHTPAKQRVAIRQLGGATGGIVNEGANLQIAMLVFIVALGAWCMLLVPAQTIARGWREIRGEGEGRDRVNGNGHRRGKPVHPPERKRQRAR